MIWVQPGLTVGLEPDGGYPVLRLCRGEPVILQLGDKSAMGEAFVVETSCGTPTSLASRSWAAHSNALLNSRAVAITQTSLPFHQGRRRTAEGAERLIQLRQFRAVQPYSSGTMQPTQRPRRVEIKGFLPLGVKIFTPGQWYPTSRFRIDLCWAHQLPSIC
jgi:hypothetical protein